MRGVRLVPECFKRILNGDETLWRVCPTRKAKAPKTYPCKPCDT